MRYQVTYLADSIFRTTCQPIPEMRLDWNLVLKIRKNVFNEVTNSYFLRSLGTIRDFPITIIKRNKIFLIITCISMILNILTQIGNKIISLKLR
jgi:hypothetical protein